MGKSNNSWDGPLPNTMPCAVHDSARALGIREEAQQQSHFRHGVILEPLLRPSLKPSYTLNQTRITRKCLVLIASPSVEDVRFQG